MRAPLLLAALLVAGCAAPAPDESDGDATPEPGASIGGVVPGPEPGGERSATSWTLGMRDLRGSRAALDETTLDAGSARDLGLLWSFRTNGSATGTPIVKDGVVYVATWKGAVHALDAATGEARWTHEHGAQVDAPVTLWEDLVLFGDAKGTLTALFAENGTEAYSILVDGTTSAHLYATPVVHEGTIYLGLASDQESIRIHGDQPIDFRGGVVALDARTGEERWRTLLVPEGQTGAPVWGTPVVAEELELLIFGTGNALTEPAGNMTDAIVALRLDTGEVAWSYQATKGDVFTQANPINPDWDFGSTPSLFPAPAGELLVGLGQKSSRYYALDAANGSIRWRQGTPQGGEGIIAGTAYADGLVVVGHTTQKRVAALRTDTGVEAWTRPMAGQVYSAPAIAPGVVFAADATGAIVALELATGREIWNGSAGAAGGVFGGLSVAEGRLYVPTVEKGFLGDHGHILAFAPGATGGSVVGAEDGTRAPNEVALLNIAFRPDRLVIAPGTQVTFVNEDAIFHTATSGWDKGATFDLALQPGERASATFDEPGEYRVYCKPHASPDPDKGWTGMAMTIVVEAGGPD